MWETRTDFFLSLPVILRLLFLLLLRLLLDFAWLLWDIKAKWRRLFTYKNIRGTGAVWATGYMAQIIWSKNVTCKSEMISVLDVRINIKQWYIRVVHEGLNLILILDDWLNSKNLFTPNLNARLKRIHIKIIAVSRTHWKKINLFGICFFKIKRFYFKGFLGMLGF